MKTHTKNLHRMTTAMVIALIAVVGWTQGSDAHGATIAEAELIPFKPEKGIQHALRIVDADGNTGAYIGDPIQGLNALKAAPLLEKLKGLDAADPEAAWDKMNALGLPPDFQRAADIAIWDIHGRARNQPVGTLLGPRKRDKVKFYLSGFSNMSEEQYVQAVRDCQERKVQGFRVYAYLRKGAKSEEAWLEACQQLARAVKEAAPEGLTLMYYPYDPFQPEQALPVGQLLDELGYDWYVDPIAAKGAQAGEQIKALRDALKTPVCGPLIGNFNSRMEWLEKGVVDIMEANIFMGFTPCIRLIRACEKAGVPIDLQAGYPLDIYHFPLYGFVGDETLPWIGTHNRSPKGIPVPATMSGVEEKPAKRPWLLRAQARPVDAEGYTRILYEIPGMGLEPDWDYIEAHRTE